MTSPYNRWVAFEWNLVKWLFSSGLTLIINKSSSLLLKRQNIDVDKWTLKLELDWRNLWRTWWWTCKSVKTSLKCNYPDLCVVSQQNLGNQQRRQGCLDQQCRSVVQKPNRGCWISFFTPEMSFHSRNYNRHCLQSSSICFLDASPLWVWAQSRVQGSLELVHICSHQIFIKNKEGRCEADPL